MSSGIARLTSLAVAFGLLAGATAATAQQTDPALRSNTQGVMLGGFLSGAGISSDDLDDDLTGGGLELQLGWGFTPMFTILVDVQGARMSDDPDDFVLVHFDLLGRFNFRSGPNAFVPYAEVGYAARVAGQDDAIVDLGSGPETVDVEMAGGAVTFGGGFNYYLSPVVALGVNLKFSAGAFDEVEVNGVDVDDVEIDAVSTRLNFGITIYPMR